jgi:transposase, IS30 family
MARRGRKRRLELESEYWRLLLAGAGTFEACRLVGIGCKTGYRWRAENGGLPPARVAEDARCGRYLCGWCRCRPAAPPKRSVMR